MRYLGIRQLGLFLGAAGASLVLAGAAHADSVSPSQTNDNSSATSLTLTGDQAINSDTTTTVSQSSDQNSTPDAAPTDPPVAPTASSQTTQAPSAPATTTVTPAAGDGATITPPATTVTDPAPAAAKPAPSFFAPVTIIRALVPEVVTTHTGQILINMPKVQPAAPAGPEVPGAPNGALTSAGLMMGQFTLPLLSGLGHFLQAAFVGPVPYLEFGLLMGLGLFMSFAYLLRRWGYAISARGSDPRLQSAYEFASPAMSELVPVRIKYPG